MSEKTKYNYMENALQEINRKSIALNKGSENRNNIILHDIRKQITDQMILTDKCFKKLYSTYFFGGSYYDGLKVGKPEEFDLDLQMTLPVLTKPLLITSNIPGFVEIQLSELSNYLKLPESENCKLLEKLVNKQNYLSTDSVLCWFQGLVERSLNKFKDSNGNSIINVNSKSYKVVTSKSGPAYTLKITGLDMNMDVDLVPSFKFTEEKWPNGKYKKNPTNIKTFFVIPKSPKSTPSFECKSRYWRLSFQEQERALINDKSRLKPALKLVKRLRDTQDHKCISSYFIKTLFLWEIEERKNDAEFWNGTLSYVFMAMLKKYLLYLEKKEIPYYWNRKLNLLKLVPEPTLENFTQRIKNIINNIDKNIGNADTVKDYLLPLNERLYKLSI